MIKRDVEFEQSICEIIDQYGCDQSHLIAIMQDIQAKYKYLSEEALTLVAEKLGL